MGKSGKTRSNARVINGIKKGLEEVRNAKMTGRSLQTLQAFLQEHTKSH